MKRVLSIILLLFAAASVSAQNRFKINAPTVVAVNEQFNVTFVIEGEDAPTSFNWSPSSDFKLVWGPQKGSSRSINIVNGKRTSSSQTTYTYVLMATQKGNFVLPEATAVLNGKDVSSGSHRIEVVTDSSSSSSSSSQQGSQQQPSGSSAAATGEISSQDLFLRLSLSKTSVVVGEPLTATLKLYQRVNISGFEDAHFPTFTGFWSQEVEAPSNIEFKRESLADRIYNTAVLRSWVLIPQQSGSITIDPAELVCLVNVRMPSTGPQSIFDSFFQDDYRTIRKRVYSDKYTVKVSALPSGAPASFGGGVGNYKLEAHLSKDSLSVHDAASLIVTLSGKGNVSLLEAPKVSFPPDFEVYDVKTDGKTERSSGSTSGSKTFEYPFIPRSHGSFTIPAVEYSYFDVSTRKYVTLRTADINVDVAKGNAPDAAAAQGQMVAGTLRKDVRDLGSDVRFIVTKAPVFSESGEFFCGSPLFWALIAVILLAGASAWFLLTKLEARRADVAGSRNRKATAMAKKRLERAGTFLKSDLTTAFYEELHKTLLGFVSDKLNMDIAEMSKDNICASLQEGGASPEDAQQYVDLLDKCEFARYAPSEGHEAMSAHYEAALSVIAAIDSSMKSKKTGASGRLAAIAVLLLMIPGLAKASDTSYPDSLWNAGVQAYAEGAWEGAAASWESISALGLESADLYYNLGNAYFREGYYSQAILNYERALKLDPSHADARYNLEFAGEFVQDKIETVPEFFLKTWRNKFCRLMSSDRWAVLALVLLVLTVVMALLFLLNRGAMRKVGFFAGIVLLLCVALCMDFSISQKSDYFRADYGIITRAVTSVQSSPGSGAGMAKDLFVLHEGTKVHIIDQVGEWNNIELADGRQGWVKSTDIGII